MTQEQSTNLEDIEQLFLTNRPTEEALEILREHCDNSQSLFLHDLLRNHNSVAVSNEAELRKRRSFDCLLDFYAILEVALLSGYVGWPLPQKLEHVAQSHLNHPAVRLYYEEHYRSFLPRILRRWLGGEIEVPVQKDSDAAPIITQFLGLTDAFNSDAELQEFLWLLDEGSVCGKSLLDLLVFLESPTQLERALFEPEEVAMGIGGAIRGLFSFLNFCTALDRLLDRARDYPLLQSGVWLYYAYWFHALSGRVLDIVGDALGRITAWPLPHINPKDVETFALATSSTLRRLTSDYNAYPLLHLTGLDKEMLRKAETGTRQSDLASPLFQAPQKTINALTPVENTRITMAQLSDKWIQQVFQTASFLNPDRDAALNVVRDVVLHWQTRSSRRTVFRRKTRAVQRGIALQNPSFELQWLVLLASERNTSIGNDLAALGKINLLIRFISYVVRATTAVDLLHVLCAATELFYDYNTEQRKTIYEFLAGSTFENDRYRKVRHRVLSGVRQHFGQVLRFSTSERGITIIMAPESDANAAVFFQILERFSPWGTSCLVPSHGAVSHPGDFLDLHRNDSTGEVMRYKALLDPVCFTALADLLRLPDPRHRVSIPLFNAKDGEERAADRREPNMTPLALHELSELRSFVN